MNALRQEFVRGGDTASVRVLAEFRMSREIAALALQ